MRAWSSIHDVGRGIRIGAACGAAVVVLRLGAQVFPAWRAPLGIELVVPVGAGVLSGGLLGGFWPWRRFGGAAIGLALAATWIFAAGVTLAWSHGRGWDALRTPGWPLLGALVGLPLGALIYDLGQATSPDQARVAYVQAWRDRHSFRRPTPWTICPCCGFPTFELSERLAHCHICEWDQPDDGESLSVSLATAQANFARYGTVYDPAAPPEWLTQPLSSAARAARTQMVDAVTAMQTERRPAELGELWGRFYAAADQLDAAIARTAK